MPIRLNRVRCEHAAFAKRHVSKVVITLTIRRRNDTVFNLLRARSSVGRALEWHSRGRRFDPDRVHFPNSFTELSLILVGGR